MKGDDALVVRVSPGAVALETAFLATGLPEDVALETAESMAAAVRDAGSQPAFIGVLDGRAVVGLEPDELRRLARCGRKLSTRDLPAAVARGADGGTTVAAALFLAHRAGLSVAATGGIGGVHLSQGPHDESADLLELARTPVVLVCSGAKAILDLPATLERLETLGVTVVGYQTDRFPAFWTADSGIALDVAADGPEDVAALWRAARALGVPGALLACVPPPFEQALSGEESEAAVARALAAARAQGVAGGDVTPFLLARVAELTGGRSVKANVALLENNARMAGEISRHLHRHRGREG